MSGHFSATLKANTGTSFCVEKNKIRVSGMKHVGKLLFTSFKVSILVSDLQGNAKTLWYLA